MEHARRTITAPDRSLTLAVTEAGAGGRPLLLLHGFGGNRNDFDDHVDRLAALGHHVVAPNQRGTGESDRPAEEDAYSLEILAADAVALVGALGWDDVVLLGHSMGGMVAQEVARVAGDRLSGLILMNTTSGAVGVDPDLVTLGVAICREQGIDALADAMAGLGDEGPLANEADRRLRAERPGYAERGDANLRACSPAMYAALLPVIASRAEALAALADLTMPTLVVVGELGEVMVGPSRAMAETIPGARLVVIPDAGHSPQFEAPEAWWDAVAGFLSEIGASPDRSEEDVA